MEIAIFSTPPLSTPPPYSPSLLIPIYFYSFLFPFTFFFLFVCPTSYHLTSIHFRLIWTKRPSKCQRRTDRTTMLLVAVLILFLITEFPQGILGLLSGILEKCFFAQCYNLMGEMMDLLALINAAIGFVLYGLMSKQFRTSFKSVFFKTRLSRIEMTRITNLNNTTCV